MHWIAVRSNKQNGGDDVARVVERPGLLVAALADGATGGGEGRAAAEAFVQIALDLTAQGRVHAVALAAAVAAADIDIGTLDLMSDTTGILLSVAGAEVTLASAGDSEAWMATPDGVRELTGAQRRKPRIGSGIRLPEAIGPLPHTGRIIIASDGVFGFMAPSDAFAAAARGGNPAEAVIDAIAARFDGLPDDVAVIVIDPE